MSKRCNAVFGDIISRDVTAIYQLSIDVITCPAVVTRAVSGVRRSQAILHDSQEFGDLAGEPQGELRRELTAQEHVNGE